MTLAADFTSASRNVRRGGWLSATVVLILAVAIGAVTAIFSIAHAVLIRPLPVAEPGPRHAPVGARRCPFAAGRGGVAAGSARVAGRPEELHRDRAVRIGQLGGTARHGPGPAVPRRAERGVVGILRRARRAADDREDLPPRGQSWRCTADGGVERRRLAAAVFVRSLNRRTIADRRYGQEGRSLRSDRRHACRTSAFPPARRSGPRWGPRSRTAPPSRDGSRRVSAQCTASAAWRPARPSRTPSPSSRPSLATRS